MTINTINSSILVEPTAHPDARKFIFNDDIRKGEGVTFRTPEECKHVSLAEALLQDKGVNEVYFSGNVIMVTATRGMDWTNLESRILGIMEEELPGHDPEMIKDSVPAQLPAGDLAVMDGILEQTIRPYIRSHGGGTRID